MSGGRGRSAFSHGSMIKAGRKGPLRNEAVNAPRSS